MEYDIYDVFDIEPPSTQDLASEYLVSICLAITINLKYEKEYVQMLDTYKELWRNIAAEYKAINSHYVVEKCKSGAPHIHGTMKIRIPAKAYYEYPDEEILRMIAKSIFLKLPKKYYKQFGRAKIDTFFRTYDTPAVYIKMPYILSSGWEEYKQKNAPK